MNKWTMAFIVCLEILANATRANEPRETKILIKKVPFLEIPIDVNSMVAVAVD